jgi:hypothetical protein
VVELNTTVTFQGSCVDAEGDEPFTFAWNFRDAAPPATVPDPGPVIFSTAGVFPISLTCTDATGRVDPMAATRTIIVNSPPESQITSPPGDLALSAGTSLNFSGMCNDLDHNIPLTFLWNFSGSASPSTSTDPNPSAVVFTTPGTVTVSLACTDTHGTTDPSPATVHITVRAVQSTSSNGDGGGCALHPGARTGRDTLAEALGNILLPVLVLGIIRLIARARRPQRYV